MQGDPQIEDGYTRLSNELLDAMCRAGFSSRQWSVVMAVIRKTYGYGKKADDIGLGQLEQMTGIYKTHLSKTVRELCDANVIRREAGTFGHRLSLNKRYVNWVLGGAKGVTVSVTGVTDSVTHHAVTNSVTPMTKTVTGMTESVTVTKSVTQGLPKQSPQKNTIQKKEKHMSGKPDSSAPDSTQNDIARELIDHLNAHSAAHFRPVEANLKLVRARLGEGYSADEIRAVIKAKCEEWRFNRKMVKYLRPSTLFNATKFSQYAGQLGVNVVDDGRIDLGGGRYAIAGRTYAADGKKEVVL
jgi:phage replication O-like protein O